MCWLEHSLNIWLFIIIYKSLEIISCVKHTDYFINIISVNWNTRVSFFKNEFSNFFDRVINVYCDHIYTRGKNFLSCFLIKFESGLYKFTFLLFKNAFFLNAFYYVFKLIFCDRRFLMIAISCKLLIELVYSHKNNRKRC